VQIFKEKYDYVSYTKIIKCPNGTIMLQILLFKEIRISIFSFFCRPDLTVFSLKNFTSKYHGNIYMDELFYIFLNFEFEIAFLWLLQKHLSKIDFSYVWKIPEVSLTSTLIARKKTWTLDRISCPRHTRFVEHYVQHVWLVLGRTFFLRTHLARCETCTRLLILFLKIYVVCICATDLSRVCVTLGSIKS
jgi:hypothetical protein